jgi:hypothetical protein
MSWTLTRVKLICSADEKEEEKEIGSHAFIMSGN